MKSLIERDKEKVILSFHSRLLYQWGFVSVSMEPHCRALSWASGGNPRTARRPHAIISALANHSSSTTDTKGIKRSSSMTMQFFFFFFFVIFFQDIDSKVLQCCVAVFSCDGHRILNCFESCDVLLLSWMNEVFIPEVQSEDTRSDLNQGERAELSQERHLVLKPVKTYTCWRLATVSDDKESNQNWLVLPRCWRWFINLPVWSDHLLDRHLQETIRSQPGLWLFLN